MAYSSQPFDVANYLNDYFIGKVGKHGQDMPTTNSEPSCIKKQMVSIPHIHNILLVARIMYNHLN
jgi:hypothetical protein